MAKPAITFRNTKGSPLTYTELDDNFNNLQDATIGFTDGTNTLSMDLNDITTIEGQRNMAITVDEATSKIIVKNNLSEYTREPMGFENRTDSVIDFDETTRVFTIYPYTTNYRFWVKGVEYVKTTSMTQTIPDTTGLYYFYMDAAGTLQYQTTYFDWDDQAPVAYVYWNATVNEGFLADERHGIVLDWQTHEYLHRTRGAAYANGFDASNYVIDGDGSLNTHAQLDISNGTFFDEDLEITITHSNAPVGNTYQQDLQGPARIPVLYKSGTTGHWVMDAARDFPVKNGTSLITYNLNTAGTWTTPDLNTNKFMAYWIVATNFLNTPVVSIMGQREDLTLNAALENNYWDALDLTNFPNMEFRPLYRLIFETKTSYSNTPKARLLALDDFRQSTISPVGGGGVTGNFVTTDTAQTITGDKTFTGAVTANDIQVNNEIFGPDFVQGTSTLNTLTLYPDDNTSTGPVSIELRNVYTTTAPFHSAGSIHFNVYGKASGGAALSTQFSMRTGTTGIGALSIPGRLDFSGSLGGPTSYEINGPYLIDSNRIYIKGTNSAADITIANNPGGTPSNAITPAGWLAVTISGAVTYLPYYGNTTPSPGTYYIDDVSGTSASYANAATVDFANFSGQIIINNTGTTGNVALWLCGGGTAVKVSDTVGNSSGTITSVPGINGYRWTNNTGITDSFSFAAIRTRNTG